MKEPLKHGYHRRGYKQSINIGKVDGGVGGAVLLSPADCVSI